MATQRHEISTNLITEASALFAELSHEMPREQAAHAVNAGVSGALWLAFGGARLKDLVIAN